MQRQYAAIDLKSFYASVECVERGLDPLNTNLVVADAARTDKTIGLAVSPGLKSFGVPGRPRLFEVAQRVQQENALRLERAPGRKFRGSSWDTEALRRDSSLAIDYLVAPPRMALYMTYSARIYEIYLKHVAPEDIHVYSIDEVFLDVTPYLKSGGCTARQFVRGIIQDILETTGITATCGIGTNLYLCKVAMDIVAKKMEADEYGVRVAELDELSYRQLLWDHRPITDFWRVGSGYARRLGKVGLYTMGDVARCSLGTAGEFYNEELLYKLFGVNAELLIDHAWGWEPVTLGQIKAYKPATNSVSSGQVLPCPYTWQKARLVTREMADALSLELLERGVVTDQLTLTVGYDVENLKDPAIRGRYRGEVVSDHYGRQVPKHAHGTVNLHRRSASARLITEGILELYDRIVAPGLLIRRLTLTANRLEPEGTERETQLSLFREREAEDAALEREKRRQQAILAIKRKFGKNAILKGMDLEEGATAMARNGQVGGHRA